MYQLSFSLKKTTSIHYLINPTHCFEQFCVFLCVSVKIANTLMLVDHETEIWLFIGEFPRCWWVISVVHMSASHYLNPAYPVMPCNPVRHAAVRGRQCPRVCLPSNCVALIRITIRHVRLVISRLCLKTTLARSLCRAPFPSYIWLPCKFNHHCTLLYIRAHCSEINWKFWADTHHHNIIHLAFYYHIFVAFFISPNFLLLPGRCVTGCTLLWPWTLQCCCVTLVCLCFRTWWRQHQAIM